MSAIDLQKDHVIYGFAVKAKENGVCRLIRSKNSDKNDLGWRLTAGLPLTRLRLTREFIN